MVATMKNLVGILGGQWLMLRGKRKRLSDVALQVIILSCVQMKLAEMETTPEPEELHRQLMTVFVEVVGHDFVNAGEIVKASDAFTCWIPKLLSGSLI